MRLRILGRQMLINKLYIVDDLFLTPFSRAFAETSVINQYHIVIITIKILGIFSPTLDASGIAMQIKDEPRRLRSVKMKTIDPNLFCHIKKKVFKWNIILELKILAQFFRLENQFFLHELSITKAINA